VLGRRRGGIPLRLEIGAIFAAEKIDSLPVSSSNVLIAIKPRHSLIVTSILNNSLFFIEIMARRL
jgi:hypothetical protein